MGNVSAYDPETSTTRTPRPTRAVEPLGVGSPPLYLRALFDPPKTARKARIHIIFHFRLFPCDKL